jgi:hypothetical protein
VRWRRVPFVRRGLLLTAYSLWMVSPVLAGEHVRAGDQLRIRSQPATASVSGAVPQTISVVVRTAARPATAPVYVDIRGPDGQIRRFPVEGGRAAIQYRQVVLRPGEMLTIQWTPAK